MAAVDGVAAAAAVVVAADDGVDVVAAAVELAAVVVDASDAPPPAAFLPVLGDLSPALAVVTPPLEPCNHISSSSNCSNRDSHKLAAQNASRKAHRHDNTFASAI